MENKKVLDEETYQKNKKKLTRIAGLVLVLGFIFGGGLIALGITNQININSKYSANNRADLEKRLADETRNLLNKRDELKEKIKPTEDEIKKLQRADFTGFDDDYYARMDKIEELNESIADDKKAVNKINKLLNGISNDCAFDDAAKDATIAKYCTLENQIEDVKSGFNKEYDSMKNIPFYMIGGFIILTGVMIAGAIFKFAKGREITAFMAQQTMPIAKEGMDEMAPHIGKAAKEISKGIKEGINEADRK